MMTRSLVVLVSAAVLSGLSACSPGGAEAGKASGMGNTGGMAAPAAKTGTGVGEITAIDVRAGTLTLRHEAIPEVGWPAMTMTFTARPATLLDGRKVGDKVRFGVSLRNGGADVTSLAPA